MPELLIDSKDASITRGGISLDGQKLAFFVPVSASEIRDRQRKRLGTIEYRDITEDFILLMRICLRMQKRVTSLLEAEFSMETKPFEARWFYLGREIGHTVLVQNLNITARIRDIIPKFEDRTFSSELSLTGEASVTMKLAKEKLEGFSSVHLVPYIAKQLDIALGKRYSDAKKDLFAYANFRESRKAGSGGFYRNYKQADIAEISTRLWEVQRDPMGTMNDSDQ